MLRIALLLVLAGLGAPASANAESTVFELKPLCAMLDTDAATWSKLTYEETKAAELCGTEVLDWMLDNKVVSAATDEGHTRPLVQCGAKLIVKSERQSDTVGQLLDASFRTSCP
jgi:hypothetical protein